MGAEKRESVVNFQDVSCAYCGQTMGWIGSQKIGKREIIVEIEDNPNLSATCSRSPNRKHANMTEDEAKVLAASDLE